MPVGLLASDNTERRLVAAESDYDLALDRSPNAMHEVIALEAREAASRMWAR